MALNKNQIVALYRKRAANYDLSANLYYLIGFREFKYRKLAVQKLQLKQGSTVVEIGCGLRGQAAQPDPQLHLAAALSPGQSGDAPGCPEHRFVSQSSWDLRHAWYHQ